MAESSTHFADIIINDKDGADMVLVPAGEFIRGSLEGEGSNDEYPQHRVYLDACYIYRHQVTNGLYARFVKETGYRAEGDWRNYAISGRENHPVVAVTWNDAQAYCIWAEGRLPTEAEWEKAARGIDGRKYPWGDVWNDAQCNWYNRQKISGMADLYKGRGTVPVGSFPSGASPYGCLDMAGNVWEWCSDLYDDNYYQRSPSRNPAGASGGEYRAYRGGSWGNAGTFNFRCSNRGRNSPDLRGYDVGFRVCLPVDKQA